MKERVCRVCWKDCESICEEDFLIARHKLAAAEKLLEMAENALIVVKRYGPLLKVQHVWKVSEVLKSIQAYRGGKI